MPSTGVEVEHVENKADLAISEPIARRVPLPEVHAHRDGAGDDERHGLEHAGSNGPDCQVHGHQSP